MCAQFFIEFQPQAAVVFDYFGSLLNTPHVHFQFLRSHVEFGAIRRFQDVYKRQGKNASGEAINIVISRQSEFRIVDPKTEIVLYTHNLPYGATLFMADGAEVKKGDLICEWDPYNAVIISEYEGKAVYDSVVEGITYREERDEQTGLSEKVVIESKDKTCLLYTSLLRF